MLRNISLIIILVILVALFYFILPQKIISDIFDLPYYSPQYIIGWDIICTDAFGIAVAVIFSAGAGYLLGAIFNRQKKLFWLSLYFIFIVPAIAILIKYLICKLIPQWRKHLPPDDLAVKKQELQKQFAHPRDEK